MSSKYKLQYLDKVETAGQKSIGSFTGSVVHSTLQRLYEDRRYEKIDSLQEITDFLQSSWKDLYDDSIFVVRTDYSADSYLKMAERYIADYYYRYYPFDHGKTLALEDRISIDLDGSGSYRLQGYIDRLTDIGNGILEIHDYKTSSHLPKKTDLEDDLQPAIYTIGVRENYHDVREVHFVWHYLAFDMEIRFRKGDDHIEGIRSELMSLIDTIEKTNNFESRGSALCDWCEYSDFCERFVHQRKTEKLSGNEFLNDPGVKLVDRLQELSEQKKIIEENIEKVKAAIVEIYKREGMSVICGSEMRANVYKFEDVGVPAWNDENRKLLNAIIQEYGIWDEISTLNVIALKRRIKDGDIPPDLMESIRDLVPEVESYRVTIKRK